MYMDNAPIGLVGRVPHHPQRFCAPPLTTSRPEPHAGLDRTAMKISVGNAAGIPLTLEPISSVGGWRVSEWEDMLEGHGSIIYMPNTTSLLCSSSRSRHTSFPKAHCSCLWLTGSMPKRHVHMPQFKKGKDMHDMTSRVRTMPKDPKLGTFHLSLQTGEANSGEPLGVVKAWERLFAKASTAG